jgi:hypothetical protein
LNLNLVLLNLARPFAEPYSPKLLKINPIYAIIQNGNVHLRGMNFFFLVGDLIIHFSFIDLHKDTPMIVRNDENINEKNDQTAFNFITEIFFMSHLSYTSSVYRLHRMLLKVRRYETKIYGKKNVF